MKITLYLILVNFIFFAVQIGTMVFADSLIFTESLGLVPSAALSGHLWQFISYTFLHDPFNFFHIFINMFILFIFGIPVEEALGVKKFLSLYFISGIGAALLFIALSLGTPEALLIGASGAVFGVVAAYGFLFPRNWIFIFFIPVPAMFAVVALAVLEILFGVFTLQPGVANFGHLGGIITGVLLMIIWRRKSKSVPVEDRPFEFIWE